ncbi:MAG: TonB-dependent receptor plug domain-containing protein [Saprospiraceae bacterium]|nr:TonB-dependent receptor plug domain-containing protein [Saprospiraceae bacterium]
MLDPLSEVMPRSTGIERNTVLGEPDPLNVLKTLPGVSPGGEGQMGIHVRGSGPDQNLVMMEGMPIYEAYHTGALSSIFMDDAVRTVDFMKSGQPARYGGRLNAVVNVLLKDGNRQKRESILHLGIQGLSFFTEGPLAKKKLTYALAMRTSWINTVLDPIKSKITLYDDIFLQYRDIQAKLNYRWSETRKMSVSYYRGNDRLRLYKENKNIFGATVATQSNQFSSGNEVISAQYDHVLNHSMKYNLQVGMLNYGVFSRGTYQFPVSLADSTTGTLDVINNSKVRDWQATGTLDYFVNDNIKLSAGAGYIHHSLNPAVKQSLAVVEGIAEGFGNPDSSYTATELFSFVEGNLELGNRFYLIPGLYQVNYKTSVVFPHQLAAKGSDAVSSI